MNQIFALLLISIPTVMYAGFPADTLIKTDKSRCPIQFISNHDIVSLNLENNLIGMSEVIHTFTISADVYYRIDLVDDYFLCSETQKFYDPVSKTWVEGGELTNDSYFLNYYGERIPCIKNSKIESYKPIIFYEISIKNPHTYFVSNSQILTHNIVPFVIGISWTLGEGITLAGVGAGIAGFGLWQKFGKKKRLIFAQIEKECISASGGHDPDPDKTDKQYPYGKYENAPYHHHNSKGVKSVSPQNGQAALNNSVQIKQTAPHRVGTSNGQIVVLHQTSPGLFHGHVRTWADISRSPGMISIKNALLRSGLVDKFGNIV